MIRTQYKESTCDLPLPTQCLVNEEDSIVAGKNGTTLGETL